MAGYQRRRSLFCSNPAIQTIYGSNRNIGWMDSWLRETPKPWVHQNVNIEGIKTWSGGMEELVMSNTIEINKHLWGL